MLNRDAFRGSHVRAYYCMPASNTQYEQSLGRDAPVAASGFIPHAQAEIQYSTHSISSISVIFASMKHCSHSLGLRYGVRTDAYET